MGDDSLNVPAAQEDTQVAISAQVGLVAQLKHIVSELSSRRPAAQKTMLLQAMLAANGALGGDGLQPASVPTVDAAF